MRSDVSARGRDENATNAGQMSRGREEELRVGFGENSISIPGLVARTLGRNLSDARNMVPTVGELMEAQQARAEERRVEARDDLEARREELQEGARDPAIRIDFQRAEAQARAQARQFGSTVETTDTQDRPRIETAGPPVRSSQLSGPITGQAFTFAPTAAQFDLRG